MNINGKTVISNQLTIDDLLNIGLLAQNTMLDNPNEYNGFTGMDRLQSDIADIIDVLPDHCVACNDLLRSGIVYFWDCMRMIGSKQWQQ